MQPEALINLLAKTDYDGFMDRHIILVPLDIIPNFEDRQNPLDDVVTLEEILNAVYRNHNSGSKEYIMDDSARNLYAEFYNELASRAQIARDKNQDDIKGALMKAQVIHQIKQKFFLPPYTETNTCLHSRQYYLRYLYTKYLMMLLQFLIYECSVCGTCYI